MRPCYFFQKFFALQATLRGDLVIFFKFSFIKVYLKFSASPVLLKILKQNLFRLVSLILLNKKRRWYHYSRRLLPPEKISFAFLTELGNLESFETMLFFPLQATGPAGTFKFSFIKVYLKFSASPMLLKILKRYRRRF